MPISRIITIPALLLLATTTPAELSAIRNAQTARLNSSLSSIAAQPDPQQGQHRKPQVHPMPTPQPGGNQGGNGGGQGYSNACYISLNPIAGCYWPQAYPVGTPCACEDANGNGYAGEFL
jgi:hypothetical protein